MTSRLNSCGMHLFISLFTITQNCTWKPAFNFTKSFEILQFQIFWNLQRKREVGERCNCNSHRFFGN